jgi:hypothetical protein
MNIFRTLQSILSAQPVPEVIARKHPSNPATTSPFTFADELDQRVNFGDAVSAPAAASSSAEEAAVAEDAWPQPAEQSTIGEAVDTAAESDAAALTDAIVSQATRAASETAAATASATSTVSTESDLMTLPANGVLWAPLTLRGTGASGAGIGGSDTQIAEQLTIKFEHYSNPQKYGVTLNTEGRLFQDAVSRGYVPDSPEGLGTLLSYLSLGSQRPDNPGGRPNDMSNYFAQFMATDAMTQNV